jgi:hypothetical protein
MTTARNNVKVFCSQTHWPKVLPEVVRRRDDDAAMRRQIAQGEGTAREMIEQGRKTGSAEQLFAAVAELEEKDIFFRTAFERMLVMAAIRRD